MPPRPGWAGRRGGPAPGRSVTGDIMLSLALWKSASDRYEQLLATWDGGRVGVTERLRLASLIWGRLDTGADSGLAVSLPEACRLSDALLAQLRVRLGFDPSGAEVSARVRQLRAQLERIRDQVDLEPAGPAHQQAAATQARLARRLQELGDKLQRGGDVLGLVGPLEIEAATFERDLIVGGVRRRESGALLGRARERRAQLEARESDLTTLVAECLRRVAPAPRYAVPDVEALGPVPEAGEALTSYLQRLDQVARAMEVVQTAYTQALAERADLDSLLEAYRAKAAATGAADVPEVAQAYALARASLDEQPTRMPIARQLLALYQTYLESGRRP